MHASETFSTEQGTPLPLGATITDDGINFSIFSRHATSMVLVLFRGDTRAPAAEFILDPAENRTGDIWHIHVGGVGEHCCYAYRADGPYNPQEQGHRFNGKDLLLDPYARVITGTEKWGEIGGPRLSAAVKDDYDWEGDRPLKTPLADTIIYELHVRGYTVHPSSGSGHPGTFKGLEEKISYIQSLGVTAVELLPMFEFDEMEKKPVNPKTGERLKNFWGYGAYGFFAPRSAYAANPEKANQVREFKDMVKAFHRQGLEVILDVVFNHTAERDAGGPTISFRGLDNTVYYSLNPETREYINVSGCGNTFNCNHPVVRSLILDCLRFWVLHMHVDGFRFDLAAILARDDQGRLMTGPSLIDDIEKDPVLADTKIIAEAWDMDAHLVGRFPGRWIEWNSFFRDDVRRFVRGDRGMVSTLATRIAGSSDLFRDTGRSPLHGVNFITCHDGFTLNDLVSYQHKHNEENGEENRDGTDDNASDNCGAEGPTDDPDVLSLRRCRAKTFFTLLMVSQGVPMVLAGDEFGRTQKGNNNAYCQDNDTSWVDWTLKETNGDLLRFFRMIAALRKRHPVFRRASFLTGKTEQRELWPDISWHGRALHQPNWGEDSRALSFLLNGSALAHPRKSDMLEAADGHMEQDHDFFVIVNADDVGHHFELPDLPGFKWFRLVDTGKPSPEDILEEEKGEKVIGGGYELNPSAAAVFMARPSGRI